MSVSTNRTAVILLASGLSRRFGWRDKLLHPLCGRPLLDYAAEAVAGVDALARVAVCPAHHSKIAERLHGRYVIALNNEPKQGMGHSIALGVQVALQFQPEAIVVCVADMPLIESSVIEGVIGALGGPEGANIVHSGNRDATSPPTAFDDTCFGALRQLEGDEGARHIMRQARFKTIGLNVPEPLLADVDTREDVEHAAKLLRIRERHLGASQEAGDGARGGR
ncbi:MAG: NTP transferase domain-containing protein [Alphaproteobacteria bacterium]|nr:NTP transferase domain-containing protein [Alphaproteobacteria bacterium]